MNGKTRADERVTILTKCLLEIEGRKYDCVVDNISTIGALVELDRSSQMYLSVGETGTIKVLLLSPVKYFSKVVRKFPKHIALQFINP